MSGASDNQTIASLQLAFQSVIAERHAEAAGNAKVSAAEAGTCTFQPLPDGRLVVRYSKPESRKTEITEITQDLPKQLLGVVLHVVAGDQADHRAKANLAPAAMAVASGCVSGKRNSTGGENALAIHLHLAKTREATNRRSAYASPLFAFRSCSSARSSTCSRTCALGLVRRAAKPYRSARLLGLWRASVSGWGNDATRR